MRARVDGETLRHARKAAGLSQAEVATALGVAGPERVSSWETETHKPHVRHLPALARLLGVEPRSLLKHATKSRLRDLRWAAGLTLGDVSRALHVGRNTYQRWEVGDSALPRRPELVRGLAELFGVSEGEIVAAASPPAAVSLSALLAQVDEAGEGVTELTGDGDGMPRLAEQLNHLFATVPRSAGSERPHSNDTAAEALSQYGIRVTGTHLSHLRAGRRDNPSARLLAGLAQLFGVPIAYFFDEDLERRINGELATLLAARHARVVSLMMRGVSPESLEQVEGILDQIRRLDKLEVADEADGPPR